MIWFCHKHTLGASFFCFFFVFFKKKTQEKCSENFLTEQDRIIEYFTHGWGSVSSTEQIWKDPQTFIYMSKYQISWEGRFPKHTVHAKVSKAAWAMQCKKQQGKSGIKTADEGDERQVCQLEFRWPHPLQRGGKQSYSTHTHPLTQDRKR